MKAIVLFIAAIFNISIYATAQTSLDDAQEAAQKISKKADFKSTLIDCRTSGIIDAGYVVHIGQTDGFLTAWIGQNSFAGLTAGDSFEGKEISLFRHGNQIEARGTNENDGAFSMTVIFKSPKKPIRSSQYPATSKLENIRVHGKFLPLRWTQYNVPVTVFYSDNNKHVRSYNTTKDIDQDWSNMDCFINGKLLDAPEGIFPSTSSDR